MHRSGADPSDMRAEDFLCDFCGEHWREDRPMVEGHHGSLACAVCLTAAFRATWLADASDPPDAAARGAEETCRLCLERRDEPHWRGTTGGLACRRCVKMAVVMLERDADAGWRRPEA